MEEEFFLPAVAHHHKGRRYYQDSASVCAMVVNHGARVGFTARVKEANQHVIILH